MHCEGSSLGERAHDFMENLFSYEREKLWVWNLPLLYVWKSEGENTAQAYLFLCLTDLPPFITFFLEGKKGKVKGT